MTQPLSIAFALVFAVACKTDAPSPAKDSPSPSSPSTGEDTAAKPRSAKIAVKPVPPALPAGSDDTPGANESPRGGRDEWRKRREAKLDTDGDGVVSEEERAAAMRVRVANMHARLDTDGDGKLTPAELANARGRMRFDDPAAIDTNHDGEISTDELAAALKARRDQWRGNRGSADQDTP
jgi:hypothetical protein